MIYDHTEMDAKTYQHQGRREDQVSANNIISAIITAALVLGLLIAITN